MSLTINTNVAALNAQRQLGTNAGAMATTIQRLSSGLRINSAADDAAGLAVSDRMSAQIRGSDQAGRNANDGFSMLQTADGALANISDNLQRIRQLAVQAANGSNSSTDRAALQQEAAQLVAENDRIVAQTQFNGSNLLDGSVGGQQFQVGANRQQSMALGISPNMSSSSLGLYNGFQFGSLTSPTNGAAADLTVTLNGPNPQVYDLGVVATDGEAIKSAINHAGISGLSANFFGLSVTAGVSSFGAVNGTGTLTINGTSFTIDYVAGSSTAAKNARRDAAIAAINAHAAATQVSAAVSFFGNMEIDLANNQNLTISWSAGSATGSVLADFGLVSGTITNSPSVAYHAPVGSAVTSVTIAGAGIGTNTIQVSQQGKALTGLDLSTQANAATALGQIDSALDSVSTVRGNLGAIQNRLQSTVANLQSDSAHLNAARSRVMDADFAQESAQLSRAQILQNAGTAILAQANQQPQAVLALLR